MKPRSHVIAPSSKVRLADIDPDATGEFKKKHDAEQTVDENLARLRELQEILYAQGKHALLVVLQGMDTGGKDGVIKHVMGAFHPQGVQVTSFKVPTEEELAHDFLWRVHRATPRRGMIGIFNRSHYEDVLVVRVRKLAPKSVWQKRYDHINAFEHLLTDAGVTVVKLFLHISRDEQAERLRKRLEDPTKQWKFNPGDLEDRELWDDYQAAYEDALSRCSTEHAPWHVIPANHKWYRNVAVSRVLLDTLEALDLRFPEPSADLSGIVIPP